jgi:hypothetical protein
MLTVTLVLLLAAGSGQTSGQDEMRIPDIGMHEFTYILPEGFRGWACVDFGVDNAEPLAKRADGSFVIKPTPGRIVTTSSLPYLLMPALPSTVLEEHDGELHAASGLAFSRIEGEADSNDPMSRSCVFFGSDGEADAAGPAPKLDRPKATSHRNPGVPCATEGPGAAEQEDEPDGA